MQSRLKLFAKYGIFWLLFFISIRILFLVFNYDKTAELTFSDTILTIIHGFRLDFSAMGYFLIIPGLLITLSTFIPIKLLKTSLTIYTYLLLLITTFLVITDIELYKHWGFRLDTSPLLYLDENATMPLELGRLLFLIVFWASLIALFIFIYKYIVSVEFNKLTKASWKTSLVMLLLTGALIGPIRGSVGIAPINVGSVYFHDSNLYANHSAVNVIWNVGYDLGKYKELNYSENYLDKEKTKAYFKELYKEEGKTIKVLNQERPNIIIIILESFTSKFLDNGDGLPGVAPNLTRTADEGLFFSNFYSSGDRTDKGIISILSGFPAQPHSSIIKFANKTERLPFLNKKFKELGYKTSFTYGGDINFANFQSYLRNAQFDNITHSEHYPDSLVNFKWGVHDEYVFEKFTEEIKAEEEPFFKVMLSSSSHEPFEVPMEPVFEGDDLPAKFSNSAHYTDIQLGKFLENAKKSEWWNNTLIVITADHGHPFLDNQGANNPKRFKIPMIWTGGALAKNGLVIDSYVSQTDIANTLLGQLDAQDPEFIFSHNALNEKYHDFVVYVYNNGFGYMDGKKHIIYDNTSNKYLLKDGVESERDLELGKAYMQTLYSYFNKN